MVIKPARYVELNQKIPDMPKAYYIDFRYKGSPQMEALFEKWHQDYMESPMQKCLVILEPDFDYEVIIETDHRGRPDYSKQQVKLKTKSALIVAHHYGIIDDKKLKELLGE